MESLDGTDWDVVIVGTGLPQSLLALSLSRTGKRILHLDSNGYYGGAEAALSLSEAEEWATKCANSNREEIFSHAFVTKPGDSDEDGGRKLASSRAYSLALAPHLIYSRSSLVSLVASSQTYNQLEFHAVGSWFVVAKSDASSLSHSSITKVPSGREDVFQDKSMNLKATRSLMKFLRFVGTYEEQPENWEQNAQTSFPEFLEEKFGLPLVSHAPILALTMSNAAPASTTVGFALPRIARHLRSIGMFGAGFGAVLPKWGGLAEIAQVACRACAVGGGVYVLNKKVQSHTQNDDSGRFSLSLDESEKITTTWLIDAKASLARTEPTLSPARTNADVCSRSISAVSSPLLPLFPQTAEGGATPAGAVVVIPSSDESQPPVYILAHSSDAGECPTGQCVLYASVALPHNTGFPRLEQATKLLLDSLDEQPKPTVLWRLQYQQRYFSQEDGVNSGQAEDKLVMLPSLSNDLTLDDSIIESVRVAWQRITGDKAENFCKFEAREGFMDEDE